MSLDLKLFIFICQSIFINCDIFTTLPNCSGLVLSPQYIYSDFDVVSKLKCAAFCDLDVNCKSFQYGANRCFLNNFKDNGDCTIMVDDSSKTYYQKPGPVCLNGGTMVSSVCKCILGYVGTYCERLMNDCSEGFLSPHGYTNGVYQIHPYKSPASYQVYCEMKQGGRTRFQFHDSSSFYFNKGWQDYKKGFGDLSNDHWLGLDNMHWLTDSGNFQMTVYMKLANGTYYQHYFKDFVVGSEADLYRFTFSSAVPNSKSPLGDSLSDLKGMPFSTFDSDNDNSGGNCAADRRSGWWYGNCASCNPNGELLKPADSLKTVDYEVFWQNDLQNLVPIKTMMWFTYM